MEVPLSTETRSSQPPTALRVSERSLLLKGISIGVGVGHSVESITVFTRADDELLGSVDGEVSHVVCSKREHQDEDLQAAVKGKYKFKRSSLFYNQCSSSCLPEPVQEKLARLILAHRFRNQSIQWPAN